ncbi:peptidase 1 [Pluteus cervinus]|uniref:Peptidase 1 n=1 Tax=Pluteus cervinus TaxID=181527 RepID=A0ACD3B5T1_9AGAR|nr:peptidase 1 [Pluteus cervinus]
MRFFTAIVSLALVFPVLAVPSRLQTVQTFDGETTGKYIVKLKEGVSHSGFSNGVDGITDSWPEFHSFAAVLSEDALNELRASEDIEYIAEDGIMNIFYTQTDAPWGLARIIQPRQVGSAPYTYTWDDPAGAGVDVYVVDTGIYVNHPQFGGRARWGATYGNYANADGNGHGTHCAGTIGSMSYGVARNVSLIAVKVLSDAGSGSVSDIVNGLNYVLTSARASGRPSIVSMSLGGGASSPLDNAVITLTLGGVHVAVAAGNDGTNAQNTSPARAPSAITVGAIDITDSRPSWSNFGAVVDIFAPGVNVLSTWIGSTTATNTISGTSMATPHVAGTLAYLISALGNDSPAAWEKKLLDRAVRGTIIGIPSGTVNAILQR